MKYDFIEVIPADDGDGFWAVIEGRDGVAEIIDDQFETREEAEEAGMRYGAEVRQCEAEWQHEQAMEAGMLHGVDAYNETMGWGGGVS